MPLTKAGLPDCAGLSTPLLFTCNKVKFSHDKAQSFPLDRGTLFDTWGGGGGGGGQKLGRGEKMGLIDGLNYTQ